MTLQLHTPNAARNVATTRLLPTCAKVETKATICKHCRFHRIEFKSQSSVHGTDRQGFWRRVLLTSGIARWLVVCDGVEDTGTGESAGELRDEVEDAPSPLLS